MIQLKCIVELENFFKQYYSKCIPPVEWSIAVEKCPPEMPGELTVNCFRFARIFGDRPERIAELAESFLAKHQEINQVSRVKAFVNLGLRSETLYRSTVADLPTLLATAELEKDKRKRILIEYSAPNTNKPQHLGHVRNNTLGMSLASLLQRVGHHVIRVNLINDRGIHICKSMLAYQRYGEGVTPASSGRKGDHLVGYFYVRYNQELKRQIDDLKKNDPTLADKGEEELADHTEIGKTAREMLRQWENGNTEVRELWRAMNSWVIAGFEETYVRMGVKFDHTYLESDTYLLGKDIVADGLECGVFKQRTDGAVLVDLGKLGNKVLLRADGTSVYITQDIGTTHKKYNDFHPDSQIWVVGDEQLLHFKMLFEILKKLGHDWSENLYHLAYGMVNLPTGKMKSREGTVVDADDLFDEMFNLALTACRERCDDTVSETEISRRSETIGMGALKFMLLKFNPKTSIMFDPEASVKFEGDTGPYVQYACARINSIERKAEERGLDFAKSAINWELLSSKEEKAVAVSALFYPRILQDAAEKMDCSVLVEYLLGLAKTFNRFYRECPVLNAENRELQTARMALCHAVRAILTDGLDTLTIGVPDAM